VAVHTSQSREIFRSRYRYRILLGGILRG